jgi:hypothetical protein
VSDARRSRARSRAIPVLAYGVARPPHPSRGILSLIVASTLASPSVTASSARRAQEAAPASPMAGTWKGTAVLTNDVPGSRCRYEGGAESAVLELQPAEPGLKAALRIEIPGTPGSGCPPLQKRYESTNVVVTGSAVSFIDPAGHEWTLALREGRLVGLVSWKGGGKDEPLAQGFAPPGGNAPLTRLSGEVTLARGPTEAKPATEAPAAATETPKKGSHFWPAFIGANIVGVAAFYGVKKATDDDSTGGSATCSPRICVFGGVSDPCVCNINTTSGAPCGDTTIGVPFGGVCNDQNLPCQAGLSCNNGVCDDRLGRCPF